MMVAWQNKMALEQTLKPKKPFIFHALVVSFGIKAKPQGIRKLFMIFIPIVIMMSSSYLSRKLVGLPVTQGVVPAFFKKTR